MTENVESKISNEQLSLIERNLEMTIEERLIQLQSAVTLIEELRAAYIKCLKQQVKT